MLITVVFTEFPKIAPMSKLEHRRGVAKKRLRRKDGGKNSWCDTLDKNSHKFAFAAVSKSNYVKYDTEITITYVWLTVIYSK